MEGDGPGTGGKLRNLGLILAGSDAVALDTVLALVMGLRPFDILTTKFAAQRGLGTGDINAIQVLGERLEEVIEEPFQLPGTSLKDRIPHPILEIAKNLIRFYPKVDYNNCNLCGACIRACPSKVISIKNERIVIDYSGCISCFCCQEACPYSAIKVKKSILAKIVGL
jgi:ferredoxin